MNRFIRLILSGAALAGALASARAAETLYTNNFESEALDTLPANFLNLGDGNFAVKQSDGNKCLELPGAPLDGFSVLFGVATNGNLAVSARVFGTGKGRRFPTMAVGLNGSAGYRLQISPAKDALEIFKGDGSVASAPFAWKSGKWTLLRLRCHAAAGGAWQIEGKAWTEGEPEPADWTIRLEEKTAPAPGRPILWGSPISGTPIRFDDIGQTLE